MQGLVWSDWPILEGMGTSSLGALWGVCRRYSTQLSEADLVAVTPQAAAAAAAATVWETEEHNRRKKVLHVVDVLPQDMVVSQNRGTPI